MSKVTGVKYTCDRCGKQSFVEGPHALLPKDWGHYIDIGDLCPKCDAQYVNLISSFKNKDKITINKYQTDENIEVYGE